MLDLARLPANLILLMIFLCFCPELLFASSLSVVINASRSRLPMISLIVSAPVPALKT